MSHHEIDPEVVNAGTKPSDGWEKRDLEEHFWPILKATAHFIVWSTVCILIVIPIQNALTGNPILRPDLGEYRTHLDARPPSGKNVPLIQSNFTATKDIHDLRRKEEETVHQSGWVDKSKGIARIPIEDALEDVAKSGLPAAQPKGGANP